MFYENYLNSLKPDTSYIPESASINDMAVFAQRSYQDVYNEAFFKLASQEMAIFESVIREADGDAQVSTDQKKNILETIKNFFAELWRRFKGLITGLISKVQETYKNFKKEKADKLQKDFFDSVKKLPKDFVAKDVCEFGAATGYYKACSQTGVNLLAYNQKVFNANVSVEDFSNTYTKESIVKVIGYESMEKFQEPIKIKKIEAKKNDIVKNAKIIIDLVFNGQGWVKMLKLCYDHNKKIIDQNMKQAKDYINKKADKELVAIVKAFCSFSKDTLSLYSRYMAKVSSAIKANRSNYVALVSKVIVSARKAVKEDTEITIDVEDKPEDTEVEVKGDEVKKDEAPAVSDEIEEAFAFLEGEDETAAEPENGEEELAPAEAEVEGGKACKEDVDIEVNVEDDDEEESVEESALYKALVAYLG